MGFNVSGVAINRSYQDKVEALAKELNWKLEFVEEIIFETASENWKEEGLCDIYFTENGTILFLNMDLCTESWSIDQGNVLTFAISETSMAFNLNYCEDRKSVRSVMIFNGDKMVDEGEALEVEGTTNDATEIIWGQLEKTTGKSFWSIEPDE